MNGANPLLAGQNLTLVRGGRQLFERVSLMLVAGDVLLLRGPNGAGKSSLLLTLAGLLRPASGTIGPAEPQPMHLLAHSSAVKTRLTLAENLTFWRRVNGETGLAVKAALERVGLGGRGSEQAGHLSGGEQQRVAIARAVVSEPALLLADEPTGNLDPQLALDILGLIEDIHETGVTVLFATHDRTLLDVRPRRVVVLDEGRTFDAPNGLDESELTELGASARGAAA